MWTRVLSGVVSTGKEDEYLGIVIEGLVLLPTSGASRRSSHAHPRVTLYI